MVFSITFMSEHPARMPAYNNNIKTFYIGIIGIPGRKSFTTQIYHHQQNVKFFGEN